MINRERMYIDSTGRVVLTDEDCRFCHRSSHAQHPAGVVSGLWKCRYCGHNQDEAELDPSHIEEA